MSGFLNFGWLRHKVQQVSANFWRQVPEALFLPGFRLTDPEVIEIGSLPVSDDNLAVIRDTLSARPVDVVVLPEACLAREISLPKAVEPRSAAAVALLLRQTLPSGGKGLVWRQFKKAATVNTVAYQACILKQEQVDALIGTLTTAGIKVSSLRVKGCEGTALWSGVKHELRARRIGLTATVLAALMPVAVMTVLSNRELAAISLELQETENRVESLKERLLAEKTAEGDAEARRQHLDEGIEAFNKQSWRLQMLNDLTEALPDSVWISELTIVEDRVALAGFSAGELSDVLTVLQAIPWIEHAQFDGPVSVNALDGESRFQVSMSTKNVDAPL